MNSKARLRRVGKIGKRNIDANRKIKRMFLEKGITFCELKLEGCMNWPLQIAHRHKRVYYKDKPELLYDFGEVALACQLCHSKIEGDRELTEEVFNKIR